MYRRLLIPPSDQPILVGYTFNTPRLGARRFCNDPPNITLEAMTTTSLSTQRANGIQPNKRDLQQSPWEKVYTLPEYFDVPEFDAFIAAALDSSICNSLARNRP